MKRARSSHLIPALLFAIPLTALAAAQPAPAGQKPQIRFAKPVAYDSEGQGADSVALADLNGDGILDLVVANGNQNGSDLGEVAVFLGNGDGTFQSAVTYPIDYGPAYSVALADLRGIGVLDVVVSDINPVGYESAAGVLLGNGDGTFQPVVDYNSGGLTCYSAAVADVNGDGIPDIVVSNSCQSESCSDGSAGVMLGNGDGTFQPVVTYDSGSPRTDWVAVGDLRGNGIVDLVVASGIGFNAVGVLLGNGNGTFQAPVTYALDGISGGEVAIGDVNGDGIPDLAVTDSCTKLRDGSCTDAKVIVLLGNGDGTFQPQIA